ncbi:MAG: HypC/HybG/HupF family hydrogenase formation chaperone [Pseudomonadota bacterium]
MCLGLPLQVTTVLSDTVCVCSADGDSRKINTALLEEPPQHGDWVLVHVDIAIRALSAAEAQQIGNALRAVTAAASGNAYEHLIADLVEREPELPAHLRSSASEEGHASSKPTKHQQSHQELHQEIHQKRLQTEK